jgi:adenylylsulfate kinase
MPTVAPSLQSTFAIWITGLPASGKSTITRALEQQLNARRINVAVLESDQLRKTLTPQPRYDEEERDRFYSQMSDIGALLIQHGIPVIFDATANRRVYRERARQKIPGLLEIYVDCPAATCIARDPKGIYRQGRDGKTASVPGLQAAYEPPESPDLVLHGDAETPEAAAQRVLALLIEKGYIR